MISMGRDPRLALCVTDGRTIWCHRRCGGSEMHCITLTAQTNVYSLLSPHGHPAVWFVFHSQTFRRFFYFLFVPNTVIQNSLRIGQKYSSVQQARE